MSRQNFTPELLTEYIINGWKSNIRNMSVSDIVNQCVIGYFTPSTPALRRESERIMMEINTQKRIDPLIIQEALARAIEALQDHPVDRADVLDQILMFFRTGLGRAYRYDYSLLITPNQDKTLHHLNEMLFTLDSDYNLGKREFGERSRDIFKHWDELKSYGETYVALATIIDCEEIYMPLDAYTGLALLKKLDDEVINYPAMKASKPFDVNVPLEDRIAGAYYELLVYCCDNGYAYISGDHTFKNIPKEWWEYSDRVMHLGYDSKDKNEALYNEIIELINTGTNMLRKLQRNNVK